MAAGAGARVVEVLLVVVDEGVCVPGELAALGASVVSGASGGWRARGSVGAGEEGHRE